MELYQTSRSPFIHSFVLVGTLNMPTTREAGTLPPAHLACCGYNKNPPLASIAKVTVGLERTSGPYFTMSQCEGRGLSFGLVHRRIIVPARPARGRTIIAEHPGAVDTESIGRVVYSNGYSSESGSNAILDNLTQICVLRGSWELPARIQTDSCS